jgi:hypothetical protein
MSVLTLADAKTFLNITAATYDAELQTFIDAAEAAVATRVGPLSTSSVTRRVPGYAWNLHLPIYPATALTSVTPVGSTTALTLADLHLEPEVGAVSYNSGSFFNSAAYDVVYTAGRSPVPADLLMAVKELLRHLWTTQRGVSRPGPGPALDAQPPSGYLMPYRVLELIAPYQLLPGLA